MSAFEVASGTPSLGNCLCPQRPSRRGRAGKESSSQKLKQASRVSGHGGLSVCSQLCCRLLQGFRLLLCSLCPGSSFGVGRVPGVLIAAFGFQGGWPAEYGRGDARACRPHLRATHVQPGEGALHRGLRHPAAQPKVSARFHPLTVGSSHPLPGCQPMALAASSVPQPPGTPPVLLPVLGLRFGSQDSR